MNTKKFYSFLAMLTAAVMLSACGQRPTEEQNTSSLQYLTFGGRTVGIVAKVKQPAINVCLSGTNDQAKWQANIKKAILAWIEPLRTMTSDPLASDVTFGSGSCDAKVNVLPSVHAHTQISAVPVVNVAASGYFGNYNVLLHEFGHGVGLSDTYQNGQSGNCKPGQPQAVMCNTKFDVPQADDIAGIQSVFKSAFPNDRPNANPNPNGGGNNNNNNSTGNPVYVALDKNAQGQTTAYFAVPQTQSALGVPRAVQRVEFCFSSARNQCSAEFGGSRQAQIISNGGQFYSSVFGIQPTAQTFIHVGIFYADSPNQGVVKSFQLVKR